jgi:hypothetical protein
MCACPLSPQASHARAIAEIKPTKPGWFLSRLLSRPVFVGAALNDLSTVGNEHLAGEGEELPENSLHG